LSNLFDSLNLVEEEEDKFIVTPLVNSGSGAYQPRKVFLPKVDKVSELRLQCGYLLEEGDTEALFIEKLWEQADRGEVTPLVAAFLTNAAIELWGAKDAALVKAAEEECLQILAEFEPEVRGSLRGFALMCLKDIRDARQSHPRYGFPLTPLHRAPGYRCYRSRQGVNNCR
jgi:hypothetical protein